MNVIGSHFIAYIRYDLSYRCQEWVGTGSDMPNIHNISTNIGHRVGHQSGLDESSGGNSITFLYGIAFRVDSMLFQIGKNTKYIKILAKVVVCQKGMLFSRRKKACGKPETL